MVGELYRRHIKPMRSGKDNFEVKRYNLCRSVLIRNYFWIVARYYDIAMVFVNEKFPVLELFYQSGFALQSWYLDQLHVGQIELDTEIKCYPNPTNDFLYIDGLNQLNEYNVKLLDAVGNQIHGCKNW